jgi:carbon storage regulator
MLNLTRRVNEVILIGDDIKILVRQINGRQVILSITAPADMNIVREEIVGRDDDQPPKIAPPRTDEQLDKVDGNC